MIIVVIAVWVALMGGGLFLFCGIARAGLQEDVRFTAREPGDPYRDAVTIPAARVHDEQGQRI